ncbi:MAG: hypothetical protein ACJ0OB_03825 [Flavobacteriaceae bacterium]
MDTEKNIIKVRVHDGIVGLLNMGSILLANQFGLDWIYIAVAVAVAVLQIPSPITKFCPVYTILNKLMPETDPIQNGK